MILLMGKSLKYNVQNTEHDAMQIHSNVAYHAEDKFHHHA